MLTLNPNRPGFDADLELLATIPTGCAVPLSDLAADFGFASPREVADVISRLRFRGFPLEVRASGGGLVVAVPLSVREVVIAAAASYWRRVYESPSRN